MICRGTPLFQPVSCPPLNHSGSKRGADESSRRTRRRAGLPVRRNREAGSSAYHRSAKPDEDHPRSRVLEESSGTPLVSLRPLHYVIAICAVTPGSLAPEIFGELIVPPVGKHLQGATQRLRLKALFIRATSH